MVAAHVHDCADGSWGVAVTLPDGSGVQKRSTSQKGAEAFARRHVEAHAPGAVVVFVTI